MGKENKTTQACNTGASGDTPTLAEKLIEAEAKEGATRVSSESTTLPETTGPLAGTSSTDTPDTIQSSLEAGSCGLTTACETQERESPEAIAAEIGRLIQKLEGMGAGVEILEMGRKKRNQPEIIHDPARVRPLVASMGDPLTHRFSPLDVVKWRPGLKNCNLPGDDESIVVVRHLKDAKVDDDGDLADLELAYLMKHGDGTEVLRTVMMDSRRFEHA